MTTPPFERGPYLIAAVICERVLLEEDGTNSLIRVIDRLTVEARGDEAPEEMPPVTREFNMFIAVKSGDARGPVQVRITITEPSGIERNEPLIDRTIQLEGGVRGQNLRLQLNMRFTSAGPYWINTYLDDQLATRTPFEIHYLRTRGQIIR